MSRSLISKVSYVSALALLASCKANSANDFANIGISLGSYPQIRGKNLYLHINSAEKGKFCINRSGIGGKDSVVSRVSNVPKIGRSGYLLTKSDISYFNGQLDEDIAALPKTGATVVRQWGDGHTLMVPIFDCALYRRNVPQEVYFYTAKIAK